MAQNPTELLLPDADAWRAWLDDNHATADGAWVVTARKGTTTPTSLTRDQALDEALCYGWIDGQARRRDDTTYLQRYTRRRPQSPWSARNVEYIARLEREGRMHSAGRAEVERAQADGRWERAYEGPATMEVPDDLRAALAADERARSMFDALTSRNRFAILYQVTQAKRPETRARRIGKYVDMLGRGETPYPQKRRPED